MPNSITKFVLAAILLVLSNSALAQAGNYIWTSLGPSASVNVMAIDPIAHQTIYAGAGVLEGVLKTTNGGRDWSFINTGLSTSAIRALAIDPTMPQTIYAGTMEDGVFKSVNGGTSWSPINNGLPGFPAFFVLALAIDPSASQTIYAATGGSGVYKSTNGGASWSQISTGLTNLTIACLAIDPTSPQTIYAAGSGSTGEIFKSTNGGNHWSSFSLGLPSSVPDITALAIDPAAPQTIYAGTNAGVYKSSNGGSNWNLVFSTGNVYGLALDPTAPQTLYAGIWGEWVAKSTNGGSSWSAIQTGLTNPYVTAVAIDPTAPQTVYAGTSMKGGLWSYSLPPLLEITISKPTYGNGDTVTATEFRLENGSAAAPCELKVWLGVPGIAPIGVLNLGSDGSFVLPSNLDVDLGALTLFPVSVSLPRGNYEFSSRMVDPITGKTLSEDLNPFVIQ